MFRRSFFHAPKACANSMSSLTKIAKPVEAVMEYTCQLSGQRYNGPIAKPDEAAVEYTCQLSGQRYSWPQSLETRSTVNNESAKASQGPQN